MPSVLKNGGEVGRDTDVFRIAKGALGPVVAPCTLHIKPFTILVGPQGTGKSLVAQSLYFFEELPYLSAFAAGAQEESDGRGANVIVRYLLDRLRSSDRAFGTFANPSATIEWRRGRPFDRPDIPQDKALRFNAQSATRQILPAKALRELVNAAVAMPREPRRHAVFIPTERLIVSQLKRAAAGKLLNLPLTYGLFSDWLDTSAAALSTAAAGGLPAESQWVADRAETALRGAAAKYGSQWKWTFGGPTRRQFDIDMASSGQRANWPIAHIAQALFLLRQQKAISKRFTVFVEEPEIHLHPSAQVAMVEILAFLVRHGFRVVMTTHSLTILYAVNNLVQAAELGADSIEGVPDPWVRVPGQKLAVYAFDEEGAPPRSLVQEGTWFLDETELGRVSDELSGALNLIGVTRARRARRRHG
ncbi:MAG: ATP-binding protein [Deltaproteobacteria bacterium]|nr:ATP-binding protein [Deltaproteobacteria bacterium]